MKKLVFILAICIPAIGWSGTENWEFVSLNCNGSCSTGTGVLYNKETGEAYALFPQKSDFGNPKVAFLKIDYYLPEKTK